MTPKDADEPFEELDKFGRAIGFVMKDGKKVYIYPGDIIEAGQIYYSYIHFVGPPKNRLHNKFIERLGKLLNICLDKEK